MCYRKACLHSVRAALAPVAPPRTCGFGAVRLCVWAAHSDRPWVARRRGEQRDEAHELFRMQVSDLISRFDLRSPIFDTRCDNHKRPVHSPALEEPGNWAFAQASRNTNPFSSFPRCGDLAPSANRGARSRCAQTESRTRTHVPQPTRRSLRHLRGRRGTDDDAGASLATATQMCKRQAHMSLCSHCALYTGLRVRHNLQGRSRIPAARPASPRRFLD